MKQTETASILRESLREAGIGHLAIATRLGVSTSYVCAQLKGACALRPETARACVEVLDEAALAVPRIADVAKAAIETGKLAAGSGTQEGYSYG